MFPVLLVVPDDPVDVPDPEVDSEVGGVSVCNYPWQVVPSKY